jgi:hypothetical protein
MSPAITEGNTATPVMDTIITIAFTIAAHIIRVTITADIIITIAIITIARMMIKRWDLEVNYDGSIKLRDGTEAVPP